MAADVKNLAGLDTGSANNGRAVVLAARTSPAVGVAGKVQTLDSVGFKTFLIADFENSPPGPDISIRFDDVRFYTGDATT